MLRLPVSNNGDMVRRVRGADQWNGSLMYELEEDRLCVPAWIAVTSEKALSKAEIEGREAERL